MNLNLAMPVYSGLVYLLSSLAGFWLLRESLSGFQIAGVFVILAGLLMLTVH
jgi:multidrug transporter EmrE-like cation transporter